MYGILGGGGGMRRPMMRPQNSMASQWGGGQAAPTGWYGAAAGGGTVPTSARQPLTSYPQIGQSGLAMQTPTLGAASPFNPVQGMTNRMGAGIDWANMTIPENWNSPNLYNQNPASQSDFMSNMNIYAQQLNDLLYQNLPQGTVIPEGWNSPDLYNQNPANWADMMRNNQIYRQQLMSLYGG